MSEFNKLYRLLTPARRKELLIAMLLILAGAAAEMLSIGAVLPFLVFLTDPQSAAIPGKVTSFLQSIGGTAGGGAAILLAAAAILAACVRLALTWHSQKLVAAIGTDLASGLFARTLRLPYCEHVARESTKTLATVEHVQRVVNNVLLPVLQALSAAVMTFFIACLLFTIDAVAASVGAGGAIGMYLAVAFLTRPQLRRSSTEISAAALERTRTIQEGLGGIRDVLLYRAQRPLEAKLLALDQRYRQAQAFSNFLSQGPRFVIEAGAISMLGIVALIMIDRPGGIVSVIPVLGAMGLGAQRILPLIQQIYNGWSVSTAHFDGFRNVIAALEAVLPAGSGETPPLVFQQSIEFKEVSYDHPAGRSALRDVSLTIGHGEHVGISGPTGSGKSTLLDILMGLLEPSHGSICIDGGEISAAGWRAWQESLSHVPQNIYLIDNTIAANIAFPRAIADVGPEEMAQAVIRSRLAPFLATLPEGLDTRVGERGIQLSGGQRQRIAIARALARSPQLLILDEATSALDGDTEEAIYNSLQEISGLTIVTVAHRPSALRHCSRIVRMHRGQIVSESPA